MAEVAEESTHVWSHKSRTTFFLSAMRHAAKAFKEAGYRIRYTTLKQNEGYATLAAALQRDLASLSPSEIRLVQAGDWRVQQSLSELAESEGVPLTILSDRHFLTSPEQFAAHAEGRKQLRMEYFYREVRKQTGYLMQNGKPIGGKWNYDEDNRGTFGKEGPPSNPGPIGFEPDKLTQTVIQEVQERFDGHPGGTDRFDWPVTRADALRSLDDFVTNRLPLFGKFQDAMWMDEPFLFHARLSAALNVKLLDPREVCEAVIEAWEEHPDTIPLSAVEGFVRQIIGWREYARGIYWTRMPEYLDLNEFEREQNLPAFFWTGETDMQCLKQTIGQTLDTAYAHHIQRLMVTGLYCLMFGVEPKRVHEWYLAVYVDAVEWVELPNTLGMSQFADGGLLGSKPYVATGKYIQRMSNYCKHCPFDPAIRVGKDACPFTTLYWDFLIEHEDRFRAHPRMRMQVRNVDRIAEDERTAIREQAQAHRAQMSPS